MARVTWSGAIGFGPLNAPVKQPAGPDPMSALEESIAAVKGRHAKAAKGRAPSTAIKRPDSRTKASKR